MNDKIRERIDYLNVIRQSAETVSRRIGSNKDVASALYRIIKTTEKLIEDEKADIIHDGINTCPKCNDHSLVKTPKARLVTDFGNHIANQYYLKCLNPKCKYESEWITEKTEVGKSLWKRLFGVFSRKS